MDNISRKVFEQLSYWYRLIIKRDLHLRQVRRWQRDNGDETLRIIYPLSNSSVVFDLGGYKGEWAKSIAEKYDCFLYVFEPVHTYYSGISDLFRHNPKTRVFNFGLAGETRNTMLSLDNDGSSIFRMSDSSILVPLVDICEFLQQESIEEIDLIKINIEGGEFELLQRMIDKNIVHQCRDIQIQFHQIFSNADALRSEIRDELRKTHVLTYDYPFVWENWRRK